MIDKKVNFLAGLPRSGSTLLGSILSQNPSIHVTPTSPLCPMLVSVCEAFKAVDIRYTYDRQRVSDRVYSGVVDAFCEGVDRPILFDKHRQWPAYVPAIKTYINQSPKIICPIRPIPEIITSYLVLADKNPGNFIDHDLKEIGAKITNENRSQVVWETYVKPTYDALQVGLENFPENILLVDYRDIVFHPERTLEQIYAFCGLLPPHDVHHFNGIKNSCAESDDATGIVGLHAIRSQLEMQSRAPEEYLSAAIIDYLSGFNIEVRS